MQELSTKQNEAQGVILPPKMKELPESERPYELMESRGADALTDAQLLSVFLQTGTKGQNALKTAETLLADLRARPRMTEEDPLAVFFSLSPMEMASFRGIGRVKSLQLAAVRELSVRLSKKEARKRFSVADPATAAQLYMEESRLSDQETVRALYLTTKNTILFDQVISKGNISRSVLSPREVFQPALRKGGARIILLHNHPSGDPKPSESDIELTKKLVSCGTILDIPLLDHIILGDCCYFSMKEAGIL